MRFYHPVVLGGVLDGIADSLREAAENLLNSAFDIFFKLSDFSTAFSDSYGIMPELRIDAASNSYTVVPGAISELIKVGSSFGCSFALLFMIVAMIDTYMQEKMSIETFAKPFLQFLATVALLANAEKIIAGLWSYGNLFTQAIKEVTGDGTMAASLQVHLTDDMSFGAVFGILFGAIVIMALSAIIGLIIRLCAYIANFSRMIEAAIRAIGVGIAVGIGADSSFKQGSIRYLKKFLAVALQGGMFAAIATIYTAASIACIKSNIPANGEAVNTFEEGAYAETTPEEYESIVMNVISRVGDTIEDERAATIEIGNAGGDYMATAFATIVGNIVPIAGLGLGAIVVLFKSGQICNDIVGA